MASLNIDFNDLPERISHQFRGLNPNEPGDWPILPRALAWLGTCLAVAAVAWFSVLSSGFDELETFRTKEGELKDTYRSKLSQAINLDELRKQKLQVQEYVTQLERQLPGKAEMDALLSDINQAGIGRGLQFELFKPGQVLVKDYYAELPIALRVTGRYHDIGAFTADVANLSRIVTLHNLTITVPPVPPSQAVAPNAANNRATQAPTVTTLSMEATARTYRYLDPTEVESGRAAKTKSADGSGGAK